MHSRILVINGHGVKITGKKLALNPSYAIVTPGDANDSYSLGFDDQKKHLEEKTYYGEIWPLTTAGQEIAWYSYQQGEISDIQITPLKATFKLSGFFQDLLDKKTGWEKLTEPMDDPVASGAIAMRQQDGKIVLLDGDQLINFLTEYNKSGVTSAFPLFYCDKELGKVKPLGPVTLSEIYQGIQLIDEFKKEDISVVVATCSPDGLTHAIKPITVLTSQPAATFAAAVKKQKQLEEEKCKLEQAVKEKFEEAFSNLSFGPRQKTQATLDLETICNAILLNPDEVKCRVNILREIEVIIDEKNYNLKQILKNNGDFEQLTLKNTKLYLNFLERAIYKPKVKINGENKFPHAAYYISQDKNNEYVHLSYEEKLAITLYSDSGSANRINQFLRSYGKAYYYSSSQDDERLDLEVKEVLLASALATSGLLKIQLAKPETAEDKDAKLAPAPPSYQNIHRAETTSPFNKVREADLAAKQITQQKGFTSTSALSSIHAEKAFSKAGQPKTKIIYQQPQGPMPLGTTIKGLSYYQSEEEILYPPGTEIKYYFHHKEGEIDVFYGFPVRTIAAEQQYNYGSDRMRALRHAAIAWLNFVNEEFIAAAIKTNKGIISPPAFTMGNAYMFFLKAFNVSTEECAYLNDITIYAGKKLWSPSEESRFIKQFLQFYLMDTRKFFMQIQISKEGLSFLRERSKEPQIILLDLVDYIANPAKTKNEVVAQFSATSDPALIFAVFKAAFLTGNAELALALYDNKNNRQNKFLLDQLYEAVSRLDGGDQKLAFLAKFNIYITWQINNKNLFHLAVERCDDHLIPYLLKMHDMTDSKLTPGAQSFLETGLSLKNLEGKNVFELAVSEAFRFNNLFPVLSDKKVMIVATILQYLMDNNRDLLNKLLTTDRIKAQLIALLDKLLKSPALVDFFIPLLFSDYYLSDSFSRLLKDEEILKRSESVIVDLIKTLASDDPKRAEYIGKLHDSSSPIVFFLRKIKPIYNPQLFELEDPVEKILSSLKTAGIDVSLKSQPKLD